MCDVGLVHRVGLAHVLCSQPVLICKVELLHLHILRVLLRLSRLQALHGNLAVLTGFGSESGAILAATSALGVARAVCFVVAIRVEQPFALCGALPARSPLLAHFAKAAGEASENECLLLLSAELNGVLPDCIVDAVVGTGVRLGLRLQAEFG